jgi:hypothetical protein
LCRGSDKPSNSKLLRARTTEHPDRWSNGISRPPLLQAGFLGTRTNCIKRAEPFPTCVTHALAGDLNRADGRWSEGELVNVVAELEMGKDLTSMLWSEEEEAVGISLFVDKPLQRLIGHLPQEAKEIDEVCLAGSVRTDEHVQIAELKIFERLNRFEAADGHTL